MFSVCAAMGNSTSAIAKAKHCFYCLKEVLANSVTAKEQRHADTNLL